MTKSEAKSGGEVWTPMGTPPVLTEHELHVWRVSLYACQPQIELAQRLLSPDELERAKRFIRRLDRDRFIVSRGALRRILSRYIPVPPETHVFHIGQWGKPYLRSSSQSTPSFNVSHSGDVAVYAFALGRDVGVDVEQIRIIAEEASIVDRVFSPSEQRLYRATPQVEQRALFFRLWTGHEARLKVDGQGLSSAGELTATDHHEKGPLWTILNFEPDTGYAGSLATKGSISGVRYLDLT